MTIFPIYHLFSPPLVANGQTSYSDVTSKGETSGNSDMEAEINSSMPSAEMSTSNAEV